MPFEPACRELFTFIFAQVSQKSELMRTIAGHFHGASQSAPIVRFFGQAELMIRMLLAQYSQDPVHAWLWSQRSWASRCESNR
jgi:hypothetical protein